MEDYEIYVSDKSFKGFEVLADTHFLPEDGEEAWVYLRDKKTLETFKAKVTVSKNPQDTKGWDRLWLRKHGTESKKPEFWGYVKILEREEEEEVTPTTKGMKLRPIDGDVLRSLLREEK